MKKKSVSWKLALSFGLIGLSGLLYFIHYAIFRDAMHIFYYGFMDIAFIPISVLLVTLVITEIITRHEKQQMLKKLNMVIGAFFSEVGLDLLRLFLHFDPRPESLSKKLVISKEWKPKDFIGLRKELARHHLEVDSHKGDLTRLRALLSAKRGFLLGLLENPNLLEHEEFTGLLWAVFHLTEELMYRPELSRLPGADYDHLANDIQRAYKIIVLEWVSYMKHLQQDYPYLFSLAVRTNPFDAHASVVIA